MTPLASTAPSAGGAPFDQILVVAGFTTLVYGGVAWLVLRERSGRRTLFGRAAEAFGRATDTPTWYALPVLVSVLGLVSEFLGVYWDVAYHVSFGRDAGPLANPAHYLIFLGLVASFAGSLMGIGLARDRLPRRTLRITRDWRTPYGPVAAMATAMFALLGFPLDDVWHRIFGQDVTEWGPTHVVMIGGSALVIAGAALSSAEARQSSTSPRARRYTSFWFVFAMAACMIGPALFLLEFDYGVPQFPMINHLLIVAIMGALGLTASSLFGWRGVVATWAVYLIAQSFVAGANVVVFNSFMAWPALMLGGLVVALALSVIARPTPAYGAVAGALIAVASILGEYPWTNAVFPLHWPASLLPVALAWGVPIGAASGIVVVWLKVRLAEVATPVEPAPHTGKRSHGSYAAIGFAVMVVGFGVNAAPDDNAHLSADVTVLGTSGTGADQEASLRIRVSPADGADDAIWFNTLSWQGGDVIRAGLHQVSPGVYETDRAVPVAGRWKTLLRLHLPTHTLVSAPIALPADDAIPVPAYALSDGPRDFVAEQKILRREERTDVPNWMWSTAYAITGVMFLAIFLVIGAGVTAASRREGEAHHHFHLEDLTGAGK
jgi:hypothetical protein